MFLQAIYSTQRAKKTQKPTQPNEFENTREAKFSLMGKTAHLDFALCCSPSKKDDPILH